MRQPVISESQRVAGLPVWEQVDPGALQAIERACKRPEGTMSLRPVQALALYWLKQQRGLLAPIGVGFGKTLITLLAPTIMNSKRPLLLIPASMLEALHVDLWYLQKHWYVARNLSILTYSKISVLSGQQLLDQLKPDLIIADEAHNLRNADSARTKRVLRYFKNNPQCKFAGLSGTFTDKSLWDYAHLAELALREGSPLPREQHDIEKWANIIDAGSDPSPQDYANFAPVFPDYSSYPLQERQPAARVVFRKRLVSTKGVVATDSSSVGCSLVFREYPLQPPTEVLEVLEALEGTWCRPDGEELVDALSVHRLAMQLSSGFYYRWVWPDNEPDQDWLQARAAWHRAIRYILSLNRPHLDSPLAVTREVAAGRCDYPIAQAAWEAWSQQKHKPAPPTETVWISDFMIMAVLDWIKEHKTGIIWYRDRAIEEMLTYCLPVFGRGAQPPSPEQLKQYPVIACSIRVHGTGKNLQHYSQNLCLSFPTQPKEAQQLVGRTHRPGQAADEVLFWYLAHTKPAIEAISRCVAKAEYVEATLGEPQRVIYGSGLQKYRLLDGVTQSSYPAAEVQDAD